MRETVCCFFGHRVINETEKLKTGLIEVIEKLITDEGVDTFLFGSKSRFNSLCLELVTELKQKYPHIERIYVRAEFPIIDDDYKTYLLRSYEETYYPEKILNAGRAAYIERNFEMIDKSRFCIVYFEDELPVNHKSGTKIALDYAIKRKREVIMFSNSLSL